MEAPTVSPAHVDDRQTWRSLLFGFVVWFLHQNVMYMLTSLSCNWSLFSFTVAGLPGLKFIQLILTLIAGLLLLWLIYLPYRNWRAFQTDSEHMMEHTETDRRPLIAFVVMGLNGFFLLFVITSVVPVLALNACGQG
jgi:hypothetical protein